MGDECRRRGMGDGCRRRGMGDECRRRGGKRGVRLHKKETSHVYIVSRNLLSNRGVMGGVHKKILLCIYTF